MESHESQAERAASTPRAKEHVRADRLILEHLKHYAAMNNAEFAGDFARASGEANQMRELQKQLAATNPFLMPSEEKDKNGNVDYNAGVWYWTVGDRAKYYQKLADMTNGKTGELAALLPERAAFKTDPKDEGRFAGWYRNDWSTAGWQSVSTSQPFYLQGYLDSESYPYLGTLWYRFNVAIPASAAGKRVLLYGSAVETEAWVWVNGKYVGHRPYRESYEPGENWFVKPKAISNTDITGKWFAPIFRNRSFFGTGGLDYPNPRPALSTRKTNTKPRGTLGSGATHIACQFAHTVWDLKNLPNVFAMQPFEYNE